MSNTIIQRVAILITSFSLVFTTSIGRADDTEIYFSASSSSDSALRPNVLFILDTSGSMSTIADSGQARIDELKQAMEQVLETLNDVNVGLMRFNAAGSQVGGPVIFPINFIDGDVSEVVGDSGESTVTEIVNTAFLERDQDDAEEVKSSGEISLGDLTLDAFDFGGTQSVVGGERTFPVTIASDDSTEELGGCFGITTGSVITFDPNHIISCLDFGMRFTSITIPQGTTITSAFIDLVIDRRTFNSTNTTIVAQDVGDASVISAPTTPSSFFAGTFDITSRTETTASVAWNGIPSSSAGSTITSPDISSIVQEIVDRADWASGNDMFFRLQNSGGYREIRVFEDNPNQAPQLRITIPDSGTAVEGDDQMIALRFTDVNIPQGATLTEANLIVTPSDTPVDSVETTWQISAEQTDNSEELKSDLSNISNRSTGGTSVSWAIGATELRTVDNPVKSVDIKSVLQDVVDRAGWCGGNALTLLLDTSSATADETRFLYSRDEDSTKAARLTYKFGVGETGCIEATETAQTALSGDDAEQFGSSVDVIDNDLDIGFDSEQASDQTIGLRFQEIDVPNSATIISAKVSFTSKGTSTDTAEFTIKGIDEDSVTQFSSTDNDITDRTVTSASVSWTPDDWNVASESFATSDITSIVQEIINRSGWASGNSMGFIFETTTGTRIAETADGDSSKSPVLEIKYQTTIETPFKTNRQRLVELVNELPASGATPIASTMLEAANYWRGEDVDFGLARGGNSTGRVSHPGSYCTAAGSCNGATINSGTDDFGVQNLSGCDVTVNPDSSNCANRQILGSPTYISPFNTELTCAVNHQVLLTDGAAFNGNDSGVQSKTRSMIGKGSCYSDNSSFRTSEDAAHTYNSDEVCAVDLVEFMHQEDQSSSLTNDQIVKTHTIGFALNDANATQFITDMANVGGGDVYAASSAGDLVSVFQTILTDVKNDPTSFVSPALATNAFNRLLSRDEVYFGLFTPQLSEAWLGNVKKYNICIETDCNPGTILDASGAEAVDSSDDKFKDSAQSVWSSVVDGKATTQGGAGHEIVDFTDQTLYTDTDNSGIATSPQLLSAAGFELNSTNWDSSDFSAMRTAICPTPDTAGGSDCEKRMLWLLGKKSTSDDNDINANQRWSVNDVLHSSPAVITYGGSDADGDGDVETFFDKILYGTNDGVLHMVNGETGVEEWRYMPGDYWSQQQDMFANGQGNHLYGLDMTPTIQVVDNNQDGNIETADDDKIIAFIAARRGGNDIYALDLSADLTSTSDTFTPKFLWRIEGGAGDFSRLGQTWSQPVITKINIDSGSGAEATDVLIFGGGYDSILDSSAIYTTSDNGGNDFLGNAIYIVDPEDGSLILSISGSGVGADIAVSDMSYSIAASVRTLDSNLDGITDRLYAVDTGGQVWRVDLATLETASTDPEGESVVGKLAEIGNGSSDSTKRRFFDAPSIVQVTDAEFSNESNYDYVLVGSGYRPHPLDTDVEDRFYAFRDFFTNANEIDDDDEDNVAEAIDDYPQIGGSAYTDSDLIDITSTILDGSDSTHKEAAGWFYDFTDAGTTGEKVLSPPVTLAGAVTFTTFAPEESSSSDACGASLGLGTAYNFDILTAGAALDWDGDGDIDINDRKFALSGGIPSSVVPVFTTEGVYGVVGVEGGSKTLGKLADVNPSKAFWSESREF